MNALALDELQPNTRLAYDLYLDQTFLLLSGTAPVTQELLQALAEWNFSQLLINGDSVKAVAKPAAPAAKAAVSQDFETVTEFDGVINKGKATPVQNAAVKEAIAKTEPSLPELERINAVQTVYNEYCTYIKKVYTYFATHKELKKDEIAETIRELCTYISENKRYMLRITPSPELRNKEFLISHSMRSTVLAITIAQQIKMPQAQMIELGVACLLHEIGMIRLPPQLYLTDRTLSVQEKAKLAQHPLLSYKILKEAGFSVPIQIGVLDHHERQDGSGYPRKLDGSKISLYAKIIAVACSFEAITAPRDYKEAKTSYDAMVEMLKNENKTYDETVIKALLYSLSLYPIGAYVQLSNDKLAQVVDVTPGSPRNPVMQLLDEAQEDGNPVTLQTSESGIKIIRVLSQKEIEGLPHKD